MLRKKVNLFNNKNKDKMVRTKDIMEKEGLYQSNTSSFDEARYSIKGRFLKSENHIENLEDKFAEAQNIKFILSFLSVDLDLRQCDAILRAVDLYNLHGDDISLSHLKIMKTQADKISW